MTTETAQFHIKHQAFEGPVEVLLDLIEKRKFFVNDVSLAAVTDDFIAYIQNTGMHTESVANFLSVAATLILIKARSLLPNLELTGDESQSISDLERRLALYQIISHVSKDLIKQYGKVVLFEGIPRQEGAVFAPDQNLHLEMLPKLIDEAIGRMPERPKVIPETRVQVTITIAEVLDTLQSRIEKLLSGNFHDLAVRSPDDDPKSQKVYTIVSFLGMLELVRNGFIEAEQEQRFENIRLQKQQHE